MDVRGCRATCASATGLVQVLFRFHFSIFRDPAMRGDAAQVMTKSQTAKRPLVAVVDDSDSVRESLPDLLEQVGFSAQAFSSAEAFLASDAANDTSCLILDV